MGQGAHEVEVLGPSPGPFATLTLLSVRLRERNMKGGGHMNHKHMFFFLMYCLNSNDQHKSTGAEIYTNTCKNNKVV